MPKMKTRKAAAKRYTVTGSGKIKYRKMGMRKKLGKKSRRQKRFLKMAGMLSPPEAKKAHKQLPYS